MLRFDLCDFFKDQPQDWERSLLRCGVKESRSFPGCGRKVLNETTLCTCPADGPAHCRQQKGDYHCSAPDCETVCNGLNRCVPRGLMCLNAWSVTIVARLVGVSLLE